MKTWKRWKRTLQLIFNPTTRQIAAAIRIGITIGEKRERARMQAQCPPYVFINQVGQKQAQSQVSAYEQPEKRTDPAQLGIRRRAMTRRLQENHQLMHHHNAMLKKAQIVKMEPETMMLPSMTAPEDDWTNGYVDQTARHQAIGSNTGKAEM